MKSFSIPPEKRLVDITYEELVEGLRNDILAELLIKPETIILKENEIYPNMGLPEAP